MLIFKTLKKNRVTKKKLYFKDEFYDIYLILFQASTLRHFLLEGSAIFILWIPHWYKELKNRKQKPLNLNFKCCA